MAVHRDILNLFEELYEFFPLEIPYIRQELEEFSRGHSLQDEELFQEQKQEAFRLIDILIVRVRFAAIGIKRELPNFGVEAGAFGFQVGDGTTIEIGLSETAATDNPDFRKKIDQYIGSLEFRPPEPGSTFGK